MDAPSKLLHFTYQLNLQLSFHRSQFCPSREKSAQRFKLIHEEKMSKLFVFWFTLDVMARSFTILL